jgi:hypothetical protein
VKLLKGKRLKASEPQTKILCGGGLSRRGGEGVTPPCSLTVYFSPFAGPTSAFDNFRLEKGVAGKVGLVGISVPARLFIARSPKTQVGEAEEKKFCHHPFRRPSLLAGRIRLCRRDSLGGSADGWVFFLLPVSGGWGNLTNLGVGAMLAQMVSIDPS